MKKQVNRYWYTWDAQGKNIASPYFKTKPQAEAYFNKSINPGKSGAYPKEGYVNNPDSYKGCDPRD